MEKSQEYTIGEEIEFDIYGQSVKGTFISQNGDLITIKTTQDYLLAKGVEQDINKRHLKKHEK